MIKLRDYQQGGIEEIRWAFSKGSKRIVYVGPTGMGKTRIFSYIAANAQRKGKRIAIIEHRRRLVDQAGQALTEAGVLFETIVPENKTVTRASVIVAMVQTLARRLAHYKDAFDLIIIDECHHAISGQYEAVLTANPAARVLGVTATPERLDGRGLGDVFDDMIVGPGVRDLIDQGYLADYRLFRDPSPPDFSKIRKVAGDYHAGDLEAFMALPKLVGNAIEHYQREADGLPTVAFTISVAAAEMLAQSFCDAGYQAASIDGSMNESTRNERINGLNSGLQVLTSCQLIGEGLDIPGITAAILYRPTMSLAMYRQQIGRALRPKPNGAKAIILDHAGNSHKHGLPCIDIPWSLAAKKRKSRDGGEAPIRTCPECYMVQPAQAKVCENCGFKFPVKEWPEIVDGQLEEVDLDKFRGVQRSRQSIEAAIQECQSWKELNQLRVQLGFKRGWAHHVARGLGWREVKNRGGYVTSFEPLRLVA